MAFVSADWSVDDGKRSVHVADTAGPSIRYEKNRGWSLGKLLDLGRRLSSEGPVLVGVDIVLGVPQSYWKKIQQDATWGARASFVDWLTNLDPEGRFFKETVSIPDKWSIKCPWFRVPKGSGGLRSFTERDESGFLRQVDACTGAKPLFATSGIPGTVGSGTRALWKELAEEIQKEDRDFAIWPFDGKDMDALLEERKIVLAETYPGFAYAAALADSLPAVQIRIPKTKPEGRNQGCNRLQRLKECGWVSKYGVDLGSLDEPRNNEDAFDSHMTAAGLLRCKLEGRGFAECPWIDSTVEGSMLLAGPVVPARPAWLAAPWSKACTAESRRH